MSALRVTVVGGGLAGSSAALALADAGAEVTLVEKRRRLGGLTWSFRRHGLWFDNGQHVFLRCCSAYRRFLDRIGGTDAVHLQRRLALPVLAPGGARASISRGTLPAPFHLVPALARYRHLGRRDRMRLARAATALRHLDPEDPALDGITFAAWLDGHGQRAVAVERLWELVALPALNVRATEASLALATMVFRTGLLDRADAGDLGWPTVPLGELHGTRAARALSDAGVVVNAGAPVQAVNRERDGGFTVVTRERRILADAVVVAVPPGAAGRILSGVLPAPGVGLGRSPIVNVHLVMDRRVTDVAVAAAIGSPVQFIFDRTMSSGLRAGQCLCISLSAADPFIGQRSGALVATVVAALGELFPTVRHARVLDAVVTREPAATFRGVPGTRTRRPPAITAVPGLFLAGAWCDTGWPATMEGAVRSGVDAATACLAGTAPVGGDLSPERAGARSGVTAVPTEEVAS